MKTRFTEEQIIKVLKAHENGQKAADIIREYNISEQLFTIGRANTAEWK